MFKFKKNTIKKFAIIVTAFLLVFTLTSFVIPNFVEAQTGDSTVDNSSGSFIGNVVAKALYSIFSLDLIISGIGVIVLNLCAFAVYLSGLILEFSVRFGIQDFSKLIGNTSVIREGWVIARDLANVAFIFLILWAGISTILRLNHGSTMGTVMKIAIAALLINFSLFITKTVIDVANIIALHFYDLLTGGAGEGTLSGVFMQGFALQGLYDPTSFDSIGPSKVILITAFGSIMMLVASWIFISAAVLMVFRTISLVVLMITSPFAFITWVIPHMEGNTHDWWHKLLHQAFFAPIFMAMAYISAKIVNGGALLGKVASSGGKDSLFSMSKSFEIATSGATDVNVLIGSVAIFFNFAIVVGLLIACLHVAEHFGAKGAETMMHWGGHLRGMATGFIGRSAMNAKLIPGIGSVRDLNERLGQTALGKTRLGDSLRKMTTGYLVEKATFGGHHTAQEVYKEHLELESEKIEAEEISHASHTLEEIEKTKKEGEQKTSKAKLAMEEAWNNAKQNPTQANQKAYDDAKENYEIIKKEAEELLQKTRGKLQDILVKIDPTSAQKMIPKELLFNQEFVRNMTRGQVMKVLGSDNFAEVEKDKVRAARYGHIQNARNAVKKANANYTQEHKEYLEFFKKAADPRTTPNELNAMIEKQLDRAGLVPGSTARTNKDAEIRRAISIYENAQTKSAQKDALKNGLELLKKPSKKGIGDVDPSTRTWIRAMNDSEMDEMYKANPEMVLDDDVTQTIKSSAVIYARKSEKISSKDSDKIRDSKLRFIINAEDLANGIGELAPSFDTFRHMVDQLVAAGGKQAEALKNMDIYQDANVYQNTLENNSEEAENEWERIKENYIRKALKTIAYEKGTMHQYRTNFNNEQLATSTLGEAKMKDGVSNQSDDEFTILRGARWREPAFARVVDRAIAKGFSGKDNSDKKELVDMVLFDVQNFLTDISDPMKKISDSNIGLLHWLVTENDGKGFVKIDQINPKLIPTFETVQKIFGEIGRNPKAGLNQQLVEQTIVNLRTQGLIP